MSASPTPGESGLNLCHLAGLRRPPHSTSHLIDRIGQHLDENDGYVAFSGGKDSLCALHLARHADPNVPVCFFDSGLEFPETYRYIADLAESWQLNLDVIRAERTTLEVLAANATWSHHRTVSAQISLLNNNILNPARIAHTRHGNGELWGLRAAESSSRRVMFATALRGSDNTLDEGGICQRKDGSVSFSPVWNWSNDHIWGHISRHQIPTNPVYNKLRALGAPPHALRVSHMLDATGLEQGRLVWLKRGWPSLFELIIEALPRATEHV